MRTVRHVESREVLHIETEGAIVNIRTGLTDSRGRRVTSVAITPDQYDGEEWTLDGCLNSRLIEGKVEVPNVELDKVREVIASFRKHAQDISPDRKPDEDDIESVEDMEADTWVAAANELSVAMGLEP